MGLRRRVAAGASTPWPCALGPHRRRWSCTPGNPGMAAIGPGVLCTAQSPEAVDADLFVIGPEAPLVDGLADRLRRGGPAGVRPGRRRGPPRGLQGVDEGGARRRRRADRRATAPSTAVEPAVAFLRSLGAGPYVVKTDGLAAGKGVLVTDVAGRGRRRRRGPSCRGRRSATPAGPGRDRGGPERPGGLGAGRVRRPPGRAPGRRPRTSSGSATATRGPNTGGMGAYSPVPGGRRPALVGDGRWTAASSRPWRRCGPGASTTGACSTPG